MEHSSWDFETRTYLEESYANADDILVLVGWIPWAVEDCLFVDGSSNSSVGSYVLGRKGSDEIVCAWDSESLTYDEKLWVSEEVLAVLFSFFLCEGDRSGRWWSCHGEKSVGILSVDLCVGVFLVPGSLICVWSRGVVLTDRGRIFPLIDRGSGFRSLRCCPLGFDWCFRRNSD